MKFAKKLCSMVLAVMMVVTITPITAFAATTPLDVSPDVAAQRVEKLRNFVNNNSYGYKYFTVTGKACTNADPNHGCDDNCLTDKLIQADWIKNELGILPEKKDLLPSPRWASPTEAATYELIGTFDKSTMSCIGFTMIAHWFIYAQKSTDIVQEKHIATLSLKNKNDAQAKMEQYAQVGDMLIFRQAKTKDAYSHGAIYTGCNSSGITVLDSNWGGSSGPTCKMQEHTIDYNAYCYVEISRASNAITHTHAWGNTGLCSCGAKYGDWVKNQDGDKYQGVKGALTPASGSSIYIKQQPYKEPAGEYLAKVTSCEATGIITNTIGNKWYEVKYTDGGATKTGYVFSGDVKFTKAPNTVQASCKLADKFGGKISKGTSLWISKGDYSGSVSSSDGVTKLSKVVFGIYDYSTGSATSSQNIVTKTNINSPSYSITSSDDTIKFSSLAAGHYLFKIEGTATDGKTASSSFDFYVLGDTYTITYNANGGSNPPAAQTKTKDVALTLSSSKPTRTGYNFLGWATTSTATSAQYASGAAYTANASATLYAVWEVKADGDAVNDFVSIAVASKGKTKAELGLSGEWCGYFVGYCINNSSISSKLGRIPSNYDLNGREIGGWVASVKNAGTVYCASQAHINRWLEIYPNLSIQKIDKATFAPKPGDIIEFTWADWSEHIWDHVAIVVSVDNINRTVTYIDGNSNSDGGNNGVNVAQHTRSMDMSSIIGYVRFNLPGGSETSSYTITYNANGGTNPPAAQTKTKDVALTLSSSKPTRTGYNFLGWATTSTATSAQYAPGAAYTANASATLYAVWEAKAYAVRYDPNGGSWAPSSQNKIHDKPLTLSSELPRYDGYVFKGWKDITPTEGTWSEEKPASGTYETGYYYYSWGYEYNGDKTYCYGANEAGVANHMKDALGSGYDASKLRYFWLIESSNKGSEYKPVASGGSFVANYKDNSGKTGTMTIPYTVFFYKAPVYKQNGVSSQLYQPGDTYNANRDVTLYAVWEETSATYTVSYNANGGTNPPAAQTKTKDVPLTLSSTKPTRTGYNFLGWATTSTASSVQYAAGATYTANASATLYAVWEATEASDTHTIKKYEVYENGHGGECSICGMWIWEEHTYGDDGLCTVCGYYPHDHQINEYVIQEDGHGGECAICGMQILASHDMEGDTCTVCGYMNHEHIFEYNIYEDMHFGHCTACGLLYSEEHTYGADGVCAGCGYYPHEHKIETDGFDEYSHSGTCKICGMWFWGEHTFDDKGVCTVCGYYPYEQTPSIDINAANFPDSNFRAVASEFDTDKDGTLSGAEIAAVTSINCSQKEISNLEGIEYFSALTSLWCNNNHLTALDISNNPALETLNCGENLLTDLDVSHNSALTNLRCYRNQLTALNISQNQLLEELECRENIYRITLDASRTFDLSTLPGRFDIRKASNWIGGIVTGTNLKVNEDTDKVNYTYNCGNDKVMRVTLTVAGVDEPTVYTVSYNANGGTNPPAAQTKTKDVPLTLSSTKPTRTGYNFLGWATNSDATTAEYSVGSSYTKNADITLYAVWESAQLIKLSAPTDLEWGKYYVVAQDRETLEWKEVAEDIVGAISWTKGEFYNDAVRINIYDVNTKECIYSQPWNWSGGEQAPIRMKKSGLELLRFDVPLKEGHSYYFTVQATGDGVRYSDSDIATSPVWTYEAPATEDILRLKMESANAFVGKEVTAALKVENNIGINGLAISLEYDKSALTLVKAENGNLMDSFQIGLNYVWDNSSNVTKDGTLATFTFRVADDAEPGSYPIKVIVRNCVNAGEQDVVCSVINGVVSVTNFIYGDANGDSDINMKDVIRLRNFIANYDYDTGVSTIEVSAGADANGDGKIDMKDVVRLRNYIANYDYDTETSTVVLGPKS